MPTRSKSAAVQRKAIRAPAADRLDANADAPLEAQVEAALDALERHASPAVREGMARHAIPSDKALGVKMGDIQMLAKRLGRHHALAQALWDTDIYEARMLACYVDDPAQVTAEQMERWCRGFDNWAICDTPCFVLFDRTPHAWRKIADWATRRAEFEKRAAFALLASVALHDKNSSDEPFLMSLTLVEAAAEDDRNFVKKGVSWALRSIGHRNASTNAACIALAQRLAASASAAQRWVGKDALRDLTRALVQARLAAKVSRKR